MVGGVGVDVRVAHLVPGADDERRAELVHPLPAFLDAETVSMGVTRAVEAPWVEEKRGEVHLLHGRRVCRGGVVIDEYGEGDPLIGDESLGVPDVARADSDDLGTGFCDLGVCVPQLRGVLSAEQSAEVSQKDQNHRTISPELAQAVPPAVGARQLELPKSFQIHVNTMPHFLWAPRCQT